VKDFYVKSLYVGLYAEQVARAGGPAEYAKGYVNNIGDIRSDEQGWIAFLGNAHHMITEALNQELAGLARACDDGSKALWYAAVYYGHTDETVAAQLDALMPNYNRDGYPPDRDPAPPTFKDIDEPSGHLTPIPDPIEPSDPLTLFQQALDNIDPGAWVLKAIAEICGYDPIETAFERLGGDWVAYAKCAQMYRNLGEFFRAVGGNLKSGNGSLDPYWSGQAADAAWIHFEDLAERCIAHQDVLNQMAAQYDTASNAAYHFAQMGGPIAAAIVDAALMAAAAGAIGTAASETVVGGLVGWGVASFEAWEVIEQAEHLMRLISLTDAAVQGVVGQLGTIIGTSPDVIAGFSNISLDQEYLTTPRLPGAPR
jgi:hypothetical protein